MHTKLKEVFNVLRKLSLCLALILMLSSSSYADGVKTGILNKSNYSEKEFAKITAEVLKWSVNEEKSSSESFRYYEDLASMILGLNAGEVDEILLPKSCGEYVIAQNPELRISGVLRTSQANFAFGFLKKNEAFLRQQVNYALRLMKRDGTLERLKAQYFLNPGRNEPEAVELEKFPSGSTIKIAVTGDVPPVDLFTADGRPAGFNTAVLAEIGKYLASNIELIPVNAAARIPALASGRVDVVFWFEFIDGVDQQPDIPDDVVVSDSYFDWDIYVRIRKK